jgi:hypothetical protein
MNMYQRHRWLPSAALALTVLGGCATVHTTAAKPKDQFVLEKPESGDAARLILEPGVAERLQFKLQPVAVLGAAGASVGPRALPYPALLYKPDGSTFVYTNPEPNVYVHQAVKVDRLDREVAVITEGPDPGTPVVTDGAAELMGMEFGVGK